MKSTVPVRVRLANDSYQTTINISKGTFKETNRVGKSIFGRIDDLTICIEEEDFIHMNEHFERMEKWEITIINEEGNDLLVMAPNGDTQYMTRDQYESYKIKREENDRSN
jgi:hypothetical protein